jgi:pilus assembly protein Flp/PilA
MRWLSVVTSLLFVTTVRLVEGLDPWVLHVPVVPAMRLHHPPDHPQEPSMIRWIASRARLWTATARTPHAPVINDRPIPDAGASAVEYGLMVAAIAAVIVGVVFSLGGFVAGTFQDTQNCIALRADAPTTCPPDTPAGP